MNDLRQYPVIGSKYDGPPFDRPVLRKLPDNWQLDDIEHNPRLWSRPWYYRLTRWLFIIVVLLLLLGFAQVYVR